MGFYEPHPSFFKIKDELIPNIPNELLKIVETPAV